jgi:transcription elongation factor GreA-like protein
MMVHRTGGPRRGQGEDSHAGFFCPGDWVVHPQQPEWGVGQVQSVVGPRVTVNFEQVGKVLVNTARVALQPVER